MVAEDELVDRFDLRGQSGSIISLSLGVTINVLTLILCRFLTDLVHWVLPQLQGFEDGFLVFAGEAHVHGAVSRRSMSSYLGSSALQNGLKIDLTHNAADWYPKIRIARWRYLAGSKSAWDFFRATTASAEGGIFRYRRIFRQRYHQVLLPI